tara:strand:- start:949 stop:1191 length:243 start_codon:yes stop_codon:yes gene_type:complete
MIKKLIKVLANPQGALVQAVIGLLVKQFNLDKVEEKISKALKYVEEPNELDVGLDALKDMVISQQREMEELRKMIKKGKR